MQSLFHINILNSDSFVFFHIDIVSGRIVSETYASPRAAHKEERAANEPIDFQQGEQEPASVHKNLSAAAVPAFVEPEDIEEDECKQEQ